ncbi:MAG: DMT family transporter [Lactobacillaceae bacterium]|jgi:transporter family-2 protein|nr:DMT family transporter [Lactobacillaceae bacterium]
MFFVIGVIAGFILALQNPINSKLGSTINSPFKASILSFTVGTITLFVVSILSGGNLISNINKALSYNQPWWIWVGGIFGAFYLTSNVLLFSKIGAVQTVILPTLGMILMSTIIETFGLFYVNKIPLTVSRIVGLIVLLFGIYVAVVVANRSSKTIANELLLKEKEGEIQFTFWHIWGIAAGMFASIQQALNGHLGIQLGNAIQSSLISFILGTIAIILFTFIKEKNIFPEKENIVKIPWWGYIGGILGSIYVFTLAFLVPKIGPGLAISLGIIGTITGAAVVQQFGFFKSPQKNIKLTQIIGVILMILGIVIIKGIIKI